MDEDRATLVERVSIFENAQRFIRQAIRLRLVNADLFYIYGNLLYVHPEKNADTQSEHTEFAINQFDVALRLDPTHSMARLYKAHCLHDLERWQDAVQNYMMVDPQRLLEENPYWKWRTLKMQEQMALCCVKAGELDHSIAILSRYFDELDELTDDEGIYDVVNLDDAFQVLQEIDQPAFWQRFQKIVDRLEMRKRYFP
jgi:hypothetical protein